MPAWLASAWYEMMRPPLWIFFQFGFGLRVEGGGRVPKRGPALLLANHQSYFDPPLVGVSTSRHLCYLGRSTLFKSKFFSWLIRSLGCVPIDVRGMGRDGLETTLDLLRAGQAVLMFPEGERTRDGSVAPLRPGIRLLVKHSEAPVVPIGIAGAFEAYSRYHTLPHLAPLFLPNRKRRLAVAVGRPIANARLSAMSKAEQLQFLHHELCRHKERAEQLRGTRRASMRKLDAQDPVSVDP